jgi:hypothetical protein
MDLIGRIDLQCQDEQWQKYKDSRQAYLYKLALEFELAWQKMLNSSDENYINRMTLSIKMQSSQKADAK